MLKLKNIFKKEEVVEISTTPSLTIEEIDEDYDDELFGEDDEWEDTLAKNEILKKYPSDWYLIKFSRLHQMAEVDEWLKENCIDEYHREGWYSGCAYTVGVVFKSYVDAIMFKLRWGAL